MDGLISFSGRIPRSTYWLAALATGIPGALMYYWALSSAANGSGGGATFAVLLMLALSIISLSFQVRRWHDLGKSGWWALITLVPVIGGLYAFVMLGFVAGEYGPNEYGPAPDGQGAIVASGQVR